MCVYVCVRVCVCACVCTRQRERERERLWTQHIIHFQTCNRQGADNIKMGLIRIKKSLRHLALDMGPWSYADMNSDWAILRLGCGATSHVIKVLNKCTSGRGWRRKSGPGTTQTVINTNRNLPKPHLPRTQGQHTPQRHMSASCTVHVCPALSCKSTGGERYLPQVYSEAYSSTGGAR